MTTILPLMLAVLAPSVVPTDARDVAPGTQVRIAWTKAAAPEAPERTRGKARVVANDEAAITVELDDLKRTKVRLPWPTVRSLEVQTGREPLDKRLLKGTGYGFAIGAAGGAVVGLATSHCSAGQWC